MEPSNRSQLMDIVDPIRSAEAAYWLSWRKDHNTAFARGKDVAYLKRIANLSGRLLNWIVDVIEGEKPRSSGLIKDLWRLDEAMPAIDRIRFASHSEGEGVVDRFLTAASEWKQKEEAARDHRSCFYEPVCLRFEDSNLIPSENLVVSRLAAGELRAFKELKNRTEKMRKFVTDRMEGKDSPYKGMVREISDFREIKETVLSMKFLAVPEKADKVTQECLQTWSAIIDELANEKAKIFEV